MTTSRLARAALGRFVAPLVVAAGAAAQAPSTDITLLVLDPASDPPAIVEAIRVTDREPYDNQPAFLADGTLVYTAAQDDGTTDIVRWNPETGAVSKLVATPQNEYSPTPIPGRAALSVVRDYGNQDQQLWSFPLGGSGEPRLLLPAVNPVGYHAWIDGERLLLFVLGDPPTLQVATVGPDPGEVRATHPGRTLAQLPGTEEMTFVQKVSDEEWWLTAVDVAARTRRRVARMPPPHEDYAIAPDGSIWTGRGSRLLRLRPGRDADWSPVADLEGRGLAGITRMAFAPGGTRLAVVHDHRPAS